MDLDHEFSVAAPIDDVWAAITDVERVAPCLPGTRVTGRAGDDSFDVEVTAAFGPLEITAQGTIRLAERDDDAHREVLAIVANDPDGERLADATVRIALREQGAETHGAVHSTLDVGGIAAIISDDTIADAAGNTLRTFATNLEEMLSRAPEAG